MNILRNCNKEIIDNFAENEKLSLKDNFEIEMIREEMSEKVRGLIFGKFAPLTKGHLSFIKRSSEQVDELFVLLCFDQKFNDRQNDYFKNKLNLENRYKWLKESCSEMPNVKTGYLDESAVLKYPEGNQQFTDLLEDALKENYQIELKQIDKVFSSEISGYNGYLEDCLPWAKHIVVDAERKLVPISATLVRNDLKKYWNFLPEVVQKDLFETF